MSKVNIHEAKTHFSRLVEAAARGEEVIISRAGKPAARLVGYEQDAPALHFGLLKGRVEIAEDFDAPLPEDILEAFEGR